MDLSGKNVVYLGGFGGIGQKCLQEFLRKGVKTLAIFDLNENVAFMQELQQEYKNTEIFYIKLDITKRESIEAAYKAASEKMDGIDVVVNGCGLMDDRYIDLTIEINLLGVINSTLIALNYMDKSKGGKGGLIVNIASVAGLEPTGLLAVYCAAKTGVRAFTTAMGNPFYLAQTGVSFTTVCPGLTHTTLLDDIDDKGTLECSKLITERFKKAKRQSAEICAQNLIKVAETNKNGAIWLLNLGEIKEIVYPVFWQATTED